MIIIYENMLRVASFKKKTSSEISYLAEKSK